MSQDEPRKRRKVVIHIPRLRLTSLVNRAGGAWRDEAIAEADRRVEALRIPYMEVLDEMIGQLEIASLRKDLKSETRLEVILQISDRIITLAGTFGLLSLSEAAKRLCDLAHAMAIGSLEDKGQVAVHVRAIRLFGPMSQAISDEAARGVLNELRKVLRHFQIEIPDDSAELSIPVVDTFAERLSKH